SWGRGSHLRPTRWYDSCCPLPLQPHFRPNPAQRVRRKECPPVTDTTMATPAHAELPGDRTNFLLDETAMPRAWYNFQADLPIPLPAVLHPATGQPVGPADLAPLFPMEIIRQEVSQERWIDIPAEVRAVYRLCRPTPL